MRREDRLEYIMNVTWENGYMSISDIAAQLNSSQETVRRDIRILCEQNKLRKTRGGAYPVKMQIRRDANYMMRKRKNEQAKYAIGREAARLICNDDVVILTPGVSTEAIAEAVIGVNNVTFITSSIPIASILVDKCSRREISGHVIIIGGEIDINNRYVMGAASLENLDRFHYSLAFLSCTAISFSEVYACYLDEGYADEHILRHTDKAVLVAESEKFGKSSIYKFANITDFSHVITDDGSRIPEYILDQINGSDTKLVIARE